MMLEAGFNSKGTQPVLETFGVVAIWLLPK
jgi:hypothetical protein